MICGQLCDGLFIDFAAGYAMTFLIDFVDCYAMAFLIDFVACYVTGFVLILRPAMRLPFYLFCGPLCDDLFIDFAARHTMAFLKKIIFGPPCDGLLTDFGARYVMAFY